MSLRLLFPLACPLPPLLRLLPTPAAARFYSPSRLSTSLVTPTSRRPINRHGLLSISRTYIEQPSHTKPTIEEIKKWDADELLDWIQQKLPKLLNGDDLKTLKEERIHGVIFLNHAGDRKYFHEECNLPIGTSEMLADLAKEIVGGEIAGGETAGMKVNVEEAFKTGIKYKPPRPPVKTSSVDPELYETLATIVLNHYAHYKNDKIDKTHIPAYSFLGDPGTGKSIHGLEFASSVQEAITFRPQHPLYHELAQRLKKAFVFHVSFENGTSLTTKEMSNPWNAIGVRMLQQLLDEPLDDVRSRYVADPSAVFRLVAAAENVDLYDDFTGILVVDGIQMVLTEHDDGRNKNGTFQGLLRQIRGLSLQSRDSSETRGGTLREAPFVMTCVTATGFGPTQIGLASQFRQFWTSRLT